MTAAGGRGRGFEHVQRDACVAVGVSRDTRQRLVVRGISSATEPALAILQRAPQDR